jgi:hypothetical protein
MARPPGARGKRTIEGEQFAALILDDPEVKARYLLKARAGELSDLEFSKLCDLRFGKPTEHIALSRDGEPEDLSALSYEQLATYAEQMALNIRLLEVRELQHEALVASAEAQIARRELEAAAGKTDADGG